MPRAENSGSSAAPANDARHSASRPADAVFLRGAPCGGGILANGRERTANSSSRVANLESLDDLVESRRLQLQELGRALLDAAGPTKRGADQAPLVLLDQIAVRRAVFGQPHHDLAAPRLQHEPGETRTTAPSTPFSSSRTLPGHS